MNEWLYIGMFFIVGLIIPVGAIGVGWLLGPKKPNPIKQSTYECGIEPVRLGQLGLFAVVEGIVFILILVAGLVYTWRKGMLEWA